MGIEEKIKDIEDEIQKTPYNKATSHHIGKLKAKLSKLKEESIQYYLQPSHSVCFSFHNHLKPEDLLLTIY